MVIKSNSRWNVQMQKIPFIVKKIKRIACYMYYIYFAPTSYVTNNVRYVKKRICIFISLLFWLTLIYIFIES